MKNSDNRMRSQWNDRAKEDAFHYVASNFSSNDIDEFFAEGEEIAKEVIDPVLQEWDQYTDGKGMTALDIGCGVGRMSRALSNRFDRVVGIDVSEKMIQRAEALNNNQENIVFETTDGKQFNHISDNSIDFVFSYVVFQHFPSVDVIQQNLNEVARVLSADGRSLIHIQTRTDSTVTVGGIKIPGDAVPQKIKNIYYKLTGDDTLKSTETWYGQLPYVSEYREACRRAGLEVIRFNPDPTHSTSDRLFCVADTQ